jgi:hypothetical protein
MKDNIPNPGWEPEFTLDLASATAQQFQQIVEAFEASTKALGDNLPPLPFPANGWYTQDDQMAEACLRRNRPGTNRRLSFATVKYYWLQMRDGLWPRTGQPLIFNVEGWQNDGQHRNWACYLGRITFDTYVIIDAPVIEHVFAYIDNIKVRTPAAALQTAKFNGLSSTIGQAIQIASAYDDHAFTCYKSKHVERMSPIQYLRYAEAHKLIKSIARLVVGDHKDAIEAIGHKDVTVFVGYKIAELYNEEVCERFLEEVADEAHASDVLRPLRNFLAKQLRSEDPLPKHHILAALIKAFNAWVSGQTLKRVSVNVDDPFPRFVEPESSTLDDDGEEAA